MLAPEPDVLVSWNAIAGPVGSTSLFVIACATGNEALEFPCIAYVNIARWGADRDVVVPRSMVFTNQRRRPWKNYSRDGITSATVTVHDIRHDLV